MHFTGSAWRAVSLRGHRRTSRASIFRAASIVQALLGARYRFEVVRELHGQVPSCGIHRLGVGGRLLVSGGATSRSAVSTGERGASLRSAVPTGERGATLRSAVPSASTASSRASYPARPASGRPRASQHRRGLFVLQRLLVSSGPGGVPGSSCSNSSYSVCLRRLRVFLRVSQGFGFQRCCGSSGVFGWKSEASRASMPLGRALSRRPSWQALPRRPGWRALPRQPSRRALPWQLSST